MKTILQTLLILLIGFAAADAAEGYFGTPFYSTKDHNPFQILDMDSSGVYYFTGYKTPVSSYKSLGDTLLFHNYVDMFDSTYEVLSSTYLFGKNSQMLSVIPVQKGYYGQDTLVTYKILKKKDTTVVWKNDELHDLNVVFRSLYFDGKYCFFGNLKYIVTLDENTLETGKIHVDSNKVKPYYTYGGLINVYNNGLLYFTYNRYQLHYYSEKEHYTINTDSIFKSVCPDFYKPEGCFLINDKLYVVDEFAHMVIFDLKTYSIESVELIETAIKPYIEKDLNDGYGVSIGIKVMQTGRLLISVFDAINIEIHSFLQLKNGEFEKIEVPEMSKIFSIIETPYDYIWINGKYENPDSDTTYIVVPYFPDGNSVEAVPTMITLRTYPNPTKTQTKVQFYVRPDLVDDLKFTIYDYMGNQIDKLDNEVEYDNGRFNATKTIQSSKYRTGIYYLLIDNGVESKMVGFAVE